jgi:hypothetical protein
MKVWIAERQQAYTSFFISTFKGPSVKIKSHAGTWPKCRATAQQAQDFEFKHPVPPFPPKNQKQNK